MFQNKSLLITGGTGSFGSMVLKKFLGLNIGEIKIFSRDEKKQEEIRLSINDDRVKYIIGDVRDYESVMNAVKGVNCIFHAAALKQVPSCEFYPIEAVKTNIIGTENLINASVIQKVEKVIFLSTDKAVYPVNAMGISKAMAEKLVIAKSRSLKSGETVLCSTRYGNVMASRGSIIPLLVSQIKAGKPLTVTDPEMTRFLMSLEESVDLVIHAFSNAKQGDIFVQKAPAATIGDLTKAIKEIFNANNAIKIIGTRHGEKLYESLISREEMVSVQNMGKFFRIPADNRDLNYEKYFSEGNSSVGLFDDYTSHNAVRLSVAQIKTLLMSLEFIRENLNA